MRATVLILGLLTMSTADAYSPSPADPKAPIEAVGPCVSPEYRQFDFWLGEWEVTGPKGKVVGHSRIESVLGGCALAEHWSSATGNGANDGKSYNQFNRELGKWEQFWVDASGSRLILSGGLADGKMVLEGRQDLPDKTTGVHRRERVAWTPNADGSVRQLWESSADEGKTWAVVFDGLYRRRAGG